MSSDSTFKYDVFLSHSSKNKNVVRDIANRLKSDGVRVWFDEWEIRPGDSIPAKVEDGLEQARVLVLCLSAEALASDWPQMESHTFRFKDPLNHDRRFIPLRLDDTPAKGSLAQFSYIDWRVPQREGEYPRLLEACRIPTARLMAEAKGSCNSVESKAIRLNHRGEGIRACAFAANGKQVLTAGTQGTIRLWDLEAGRCVREFAGHTKVVNTVDWSADQSLALTGAQDNTARVWHVDKGTCLQVFSTPWNVWSVALCPDKQHALYGISDGVVRYSNINSGNVLQTLQGHGNNLILSVVCSVDQLRAISAGTDKRICVWDLETGQRLQVLTGHTGEVGSVVFTADRQLALSGSEDGTLRLWNVESGACLRVLEGHTGRVDELVLSADERLALSGARDRTVRLWDMHFGACLRVLVGHTNAVVGIAWSPDGRQAFSGSSDGEIRIWDLSEFATAAGVARFSSLAVDQVQYTNAKVLLVGNSAAGKTGLTNRLALDTYKKTDSTVGAWATQWKLPLPESDGVAGNPSRLNNESGRRQNAIAANVEREVWLWDFGGQADQRLIHQLFMDQTQVAALVFDPQKDDVFETLGQWDRDLSQADKEKAGRMTKLLVAGRCDAGGLRVARKQIDDFVTERGYAAYLETSAKTGSGCAQLKHAIIDGIQWENIPWRSSPVLFKRLKDEIIRIKDKGRVLMRFNELREVLALQLQGDDTRFTDSELKAVIGLLAGPGIVWELQFGSWVLLQPERINAYAQAVIQTIREDEHDRGCILEQRVLDGDLIYHASHDRLPPDEERFVLLAMHQILVERGLCIRHQTANDQILLIFPSYYRRERQEPIQLPTVQVSYRFNGFLDEIYATLVVKLHHTSEFDHDQLWRYAADFKTRESKKSLGLSLNRMAPGEGELQVYFADDVPTGDKMIFSKYVHEHLLQYADDVVRLRHYVCQNEHRGGPCNTTANLEVAMERLEDDGEDAWIRCQRCDTRLPLWDDLEERFADPETKLLVQELREAAQIVLDNTSKERVLVGEVISTVALADQLCQEITQADHGIDMDVIFRNDAGEATGQKAHLQLKSGDSFLTTRKKDGAEIFKSFDQRQVRFWMDQAFPVMLVIRNSRGEIRWMEIRDYLRQVTNHGKKQVRQIEFKGSRFDVMSVRRWRDSALRSEVG